VYNDKNLTCADCGQEFVFTASEQDFYAAGGAGGYGGGGGGYGARDRGPREMFAATCSSCGREAQVPFRPTSGKPVYCSDCFRSQRGG
jgi:CxxC-x17-CxxC domain-containing protein